MSNFGKKRKDLKKSKKNDFEEENEIMDIEHIGKGENFQSVTFDFLEPDHKFHKNVYNLIRKSFCFVTWDLFQLIEAICEQNEFGIFLGVPDEEDPTETAGNHKMEQEESESDLYAVLSIVNFSKLPTKLFSDRLASFCLGICSEQTRPLFTSVFAKPESLGLLINDRVINLPSMIMPTIFDQLMEDKKFIETSEDYTDEERLLYTPELLLYFVPANQPSAAKKDKDVSSANNNGNDKKNSTQNLLFYKQEDKLLFNKAVVVEEVPHKQNEDLRLFMLLVRYEDFLGLVLSKALFN